MAKRRFKVKKTLLSFNTVRFNEEELKEMNINPGEMVEMESKARKLKLMAEGTTYLAVKRGEIHLHPDKMAILDVKEEEEVEVRKSA